MAVLVIISIIEVGMKTKPIDCTAPQNCLVGKALFLGALRGNDD